MEEWISEWVLAEIVLRQPTASQLSAKEKEEGSKYQVQLKLGTRHRTNSLQKIGRDKEEITGCFMQSTVEIKKKV
jgi:hypothetical protein